MEILRVLRARGPSAVREVQEALQRPWSPPAAGEGWTLELAEGWLVAPGDREKDWVVRKR